MAMQREVGFRATTAHSAEPNRKSQPTSDVTTSTREVIWIVVKAHGFAA